MAAESKSSKKALQKLFFEACEEGILDEVERLLKVGAKPNKVDENNKTALMIASEKGHAAVVQLLLEAGARPDERREGDTDGRRSLTKETGYSALLYATENKHAPVVNLLLEAKADPKLARKFKNGKTPLVYAAKNGCTEIVDSLLKAGACQGSDAQVGEAFVAASKGGHVTIARSLLDAKISSEKPDMIDKVEVLEEAVEVGHNAIVKTLLDAKASPNQTDKDGSTILQKASRAGYASVVTTLLEAKAYPNQADKKGRTALIAAAGCGATAVARSLLEKRAYPDHEDKAGITALMQASENGHEDTVRLLLGLSGSGSSSSTSPVTVVIPAASRAALASRPMLGTKAIALIKNQQGKTARDLSVNPRDPSVNLEIQKMLYKAERIERKEAVKIGFFQSPTGGTEIINEENANRLAQIVNDYELSEELDLPTIPAKR